MLRYWDSFREHIRQVRRHWWALTVAGAGAILGAIALVVPAPSNSKPVVATWLWLALLLGGIIVAQFLSFDEARVSRDEARRELEQRLDSVRYRFVMQGLDGGMARGVLEDGSEAEGYQFRLTFANGGLDPIYYRVEAMAISIGGHEAAPGSEFASADGILLPSMPYQFSYHFIKAPLPDSDNGILPGGEGSYTVVYGHPTESPRFRTTHRFRIYWTMTNERVPMATWLDIGSISHDPVPAD